MSTESIYARVLELAGRSAAPKPALRHLDIGSGRGELIRRFQQQYGARSSACDYTDALMQAPGQRVDIADLNTQNLPYPDEAFDIVTATEVIEHLEDFRRIVREIHRVLIPGGMCILSTPNVLNLNSRLRFLGFGFWNLFGPLPVRNSKLYSTGGHINPCSWFYLAHSLLDAGFERVTPHIDRIQRSAIPKWVLLWPLLTALRMQAVHRERHRYRTLDPANEPIVAAMNSRSMLLGRTIIVQAFRPESALSASAPRQEAAHSP